MTGTVSSSRRCSRISSIGAASCLFFACLVLLLGGCSLTHEVARVAVAETPFTLVILEDEKQLLRYRVYAGNTPVSDERLVGGHCGKEGLPNPDISKGLSVVRIPADAGP